MATDLFTLAATLTLNTASFNSGIRNAVKQGNNFANAIQGKLSAGTIAIGNLMSDMTKAGARMFFNLTKDSLNLAGQLEQNLGGTEAVFGAWAENVQGKAATAFKDMGLSMSDYLANANKMGALFKGSGFSTAEAFDMSSNAMQRASDVASIMGLDINSAMEAVSAMAKGNFTMMDNLGVAINDTTLANYALEKGMTKSVAKMSTAEKISLAYMLFMEKTAGYAGNYAKENDTLAGSLQTAKAAFDNFMSGGGTVDDFVDATLHAGKVVIRNLGEIVPRLGQGVLEAMRKAWPKLKASLVGFWDNDLPGIIKDGANGLIDGINQFFGTNIPKIERLDFPKWADISGSVSTWWNGVKENVQAACAWTLKLFDDPHEAGADIHKAISGWWSGTARPAIEGACTWTLQVFTAPDENGQTEFQKWWDSKARPVIEGAANWTLGMFGFPNLATIEREFNAWWAPIQAWLNERLQLNVDHGSVMWGETPGLEDFATNWAEYQRTMDAFYRGIFDFATGAFPLDHADYAWTEPEVEVDASVSDDSQRNMQGQLNSMDLQANATLSINVVSMKNAANAALSAATSAFQGIWNNAWVLEDMNRGYATGLNSVPYDNFPAYLHKGEAVLTRTQADRWRNGHDGGSVTIDYDRMASAIASAMGGMSVQMDGHAVGVLVTPTVSGEIARQTRARRFTG